MQVSSKNKAWVIVEKMRTLSVKSIFLIFIKNNVFLHSDLIVSTGKENDIFI